MQGVLCWHLFESNAVAFCLSTVSGLRAMPKIDHLGLLFQELRVEGNRCFDEVSQSLLIIPHPHIGVDAIFHLRVVAGKNLTLILSLLSLTQADLE